MAVITGGGLVRIPEVSYAYSSSASMALVGVTISTVNHSMWYILQVPKDGEIDKVGFGVHSVTTSAQWHVQVETVDGSGTPSGTLKDTSSEGDVTISAGSTFYEVTLDADCTVSKGDFIAIRIINNNTGWAAFRTGYPVNSSLTQYCGATFASDSKYTRFPVAGFIYDDNVAVGTPGAVPCQTLNTIFFNSSDTPDERGAKFELPFRVRVAGYWYYGRPHDHTGKLYDDSDTVLASIFVDGDLRPVTFYNGVSDVLFPESVEIVPLDTYRITLVPGATDMRLVQFTAKDAIWARACYMWGNEGTPIVNVHHQTERTNGGAWTDSTDEVVTIGLLVDGIPHGRLTANPFFGRAE